MDTEIEIEQPEVMPFQSREREVQERIMEEIRKMHRSPRKRKKEDKYEESPDQCVIDGLEEEGKRIYV